MLQMWSGLPFRGLFSRLSSPQRGCLATAVIPSEARNPYFPGVRSG